MVRITVLGALTAQVAGDAIRLGGPRQRAVLARLLVARGAPVSADRLIDDLWGGAPPAKAAVSLQTYVSNLRRLLEPARGPRQEPRLLVSAERGYAVREVDTDAAEFETLVAAGEPRRALELWQGAAYGEFADRPWAATETARLEELRTGARESATALALGEGRLAPAVQDATALVEDHPLREEGWRLLALALWHAGRQADALAAVRRARTHLATELGLDPGPALTELETAILRQQLDRLALPTAPAGQIGAGRGSDGGSDEDAAGRGGSGAPGGGWGQPAAPASGFTDRGVPGKAARPDGRSAAGERRASPVAPARTTAGRPGGVFVGRQEELASLRRAAQAARGGAGFALVSGEAGAGKSTLLGRLAEELAGQGWRVVTGRCPESAGAPAAWAWTEVLRELARQEPDAATDPELAPLLADSGPVRPILPGARRRIIRPQPGGWEVPPPPAPRGAGRCPHGSTGKPSKYTQYEDGSPALPAGRPTPHADPTRSTGQALEPTARQDALSGRFRLHRAVVARLHAAARTTPLAVLLDDLHAADPETRELLGELAAHHAPGAPGGGLLVVAALRPGEGELADVLARLARRSPTRVPLGGLAEADAGRLIEAVCAAPVRPETVHALAERTGGNPFYLAESAQLLALEDESTALKQVPQGVRDVLRRRFERLPAPAVDLLRLAAVAGRESDVDLLVRAGEQDEDTATEAVEAAVAGGLLLEPRPGTVRFAHLLVRDTLYADLGGLRRARLHGRIGHALRELRPGELAALAHHFTQAATTATAELAVEHCVRAAEAAERRYAHRSAVTLLRQAVDNLERAAEQPGEDRAARRIALLGALLRAQVRAGQVADAGDTKARALRLARESGREDLLIAAWTAWTEPTPWVTHPYGTLDQDAIDTLSRLLRRTDLPPATQCRLLDALTHELDCTGSPAAVDAAVRAVTLARAENDPRLLCLALAAQARACDHELAAVDRLHLAEEIAALAVEHDLPAYRWHAEHLAATAAAVRGDLPALRRHLAAGEELAQRYRLVELSDVVLCQRGMLELAADRVESAVALYDRAMASLRARSSLHADALDALVRIVIAHRQGRLAEMLPLIEHHRAEYGPLVADIAALALLAAGRPREEARAARAERRTVQADYFRSLFLVLRADAAMALDERAEMAELLDELRPFADLVAGASSTSIASRPVALSLGELAHRLGRAAEAAKHFRHAAEVARRWESPSWEAQAREALTAPAR